MESISRDQRKLHKTVLVLLTLAISIVFIGMIRGFLTALFLAAIFSGMCFPLNSWLRGKLRGRETLAALGTLALVTLMILVPLLGLFGVVAAQAFELSEQILPWIKQHTDGASGLSELIPPGVPYRERLEEYSGQIMTKVGELAAKVGSFLVSGLSAATQGTAEFFLALFVMLYAMFFFLKEGHALRDATLRYFPLPTDVKQKLIDKGVSVARATIKGTIVIGIVQGLLGGLAFAVVGLPGAALWGTVMAVASVIPGIGTALVWIPAVGYLLVVGKTWPAVGLAIWCALVVGTVDNLLRPKLVGSDTEMPDILILVSTFGGLSMFGAVGLIIGPMVAAIFMAVWGIFGQAFRVTDADPVAAEGAS